MDDAQKVTVFGRGSCVIGGGEGASVVQDFRLTLAEGESGRTQKEAEHRRRRIIVSTE